MTHTILRVKRTTLIHTCDEMEMQHTDDRVVLRRVYVSETIHCNQILISKQRLESGFLITF